MPAAAAACLSPPAGAAAAASLSDLVLGPMRSGTVLGRSSAAVWMDVAHRIIVLSGPAGSHLPNAVVLGRRQPFPAGPMRAASVGAGEVRVADHRFRVVRWWQPRPTLRPTRPAVVRRNGASCTPAVPVHDDCGLGAALARGCTTDVIASARHLLGRGPGLTPEGDDILIGALASYSLLAGALGRHPAGFIADLRTPLLHLAQRRTNRLAVGLLGHALEGEVVHELARLLQALTGWAPLGPAVDDLLRVGHSSGAAMAFGAVRAVAAVAGTE